MLDLSRRSVAPLPLSGTDGAELRVLRESDITPAYVQGMSDPEVRRFVSVGRGALDERAIKDFVAENWSRPDCLLFGLFVDGVHRGNVRLHDYDGRTVWLGIAVFDPAIRGKGFGSRALAAACDFAFGTLSCVSVRAGIDRENAVSVAAFRKAGFAIVEEKPDGFLLARRAPLAKLAIGTVNFGMPYGAVPGSGQVPAEEAAVIVAAAVASGIDRFDTAVGYGAAEEVLGASLARAKASAARVVTKILPLPDGAFDDGAAAAVASQVGRARDRLGVSALDAVLVHRASDLTGRDGPRLWDLLQRLRAEGLARRIGVSVYDAAEIDAVLARLVPDVVQLPLSIADQRLVRSGHLATLADKGVEIHVRSAFLQGVLLARQEGIDRFFARVAQELAALDAAARARSVSRLALCLAFVARLPQVSQVVVGVNSLQQLQEIVAAAGRPVGITEADAGDCAWRDERLLNPSNWPKLRNPALSEA